MREDLKMASAAKSFSSFDINNYSELLNSSYTSTTAPKKIPEKKKKAYLKHEMFIMFGIAILFTRLNNTPQAEDDLEKMWETCREYDRKWADIFRYRTALRLISIPGKAGSAMVQLIYHIAHRVIRFN